MTLYGYYHHQTKGMSPHNDIRMTAVQMPLNLIQCYYSSHHLKAVYLKPIYFINLSLTPITLRLVTFARFSRLLSMNFAETGMYTQNPLKPTPLPRMSLMEWDGLHSKKWTHAERVHLRAKDQLGTNIVGIDPPLLGRKHFAQPYSGTYDYKPCLRLFPDRANRVSKDEGFSFKKVAFVPPQRRYNQSDKLKSAANQSLRSSSSFPNFQTKSMMDKSNPNELVFGSSAKAQMDPSASVSSLNNKKPVRVNYNKGTWKEREEREVRGEDEKAVKELGVWERELGRSSSRENMGAPQRGGSQNLLGRSFKR